MVDTAPVSSPDLPPLWALQAISDAGYIAFKIDDHVDYWRLPGRDPLSWRGAIGQLGKDQAALRVENAKLRAVGPKPLWKDPKILTVLAAVIPTVGMQISGQFDDFLTHLPASWASLLKLAVAAGSALILVGYSQSHAQAALGQAEAVKQIEPEKPSS